MELRSCKPFALEMVLSITSFPEENNEIEGGMEYYYILTL